MPVALHPTQAAWTRLSPWLDELIRLSPTARRQRLAEIGQQNPSLASPLGALLAELDALDQSAFMAAPAQSVASAPPLAAGAGEVVGAYRLERLLGEGGMGAVWLASRSDGRFQGQVAIKFLHSAQRNPLLVQRFEREAQLLARLAHPHITRLLDAGLTAVSQQPYLVLEHVPGQPIDQWCDSQGLDLAARLRLLLDVLDAVAHAHDRGVLHRDLKPSNILVTPQGQVKLLDFGIARLIDGSQDDGADLTRAVGQPYTPRWASPEQMAGAELTTASDVFSLGLLMHLLLTGQHPLGNEVSVQNTRGLLELLAVPLPLASARLQAAAPVPDLARQRTWVRALRGDLDTLIAKALKREPAERYRGAGDMADDLRRHLRHEPILARPDSALYRARRFLRRHWLSVGAVAAVVSALATGGGLALLQAEEARAQRAQAEGLLEFMLGDLRDRLEPLGQLALLDGVGQRARAYYEAQPLASLDDAGLARRSEALLVLANIAQQRNSPQDMARLAADAQASSLLLLQRQPQATEALTLAARTASLAAWAAELQGELSQSAAHYQQALAWSEQALALRPDDVDLRLHLADMQGEWAAYLVQKDNASAPAGLALFEREHAVQLAHAPQRPALWKDVSVNRSWVADALYGLGRYEESLAAVQAHRQAHQRIPGLAQQPVAQWDGVLAMNREAGTLLALGRLDEALAVAERTVAQGSALVASDPGNAAWATSSALHLHQQAGILSALGRPADALRQLRQAQQRLQQLPRSTEDAPATVQEAWLRVLGALGRLQPQDKAVFDELSERLLAERAQHAITPRTDGMARDVARAQLGLGAMWAARQRPEAARQAWAAGLAVLGGDHLQKEPLPLRVDLLLALGQNQAARAEAQALQAQGWRQTWPGL